MLRPSVYLTCLLANFLLRHQKTNFKKDEICIFQVVKKDEIYIIQVFKQHEIDVWKMKNSAAHCELLFFTLLFCEDSNLGQGRKRRHPEP